MKLIVAIFTLHLIIISLLIATYVRQNRIEERIAFICALPIVTNKSVLLLQEREGKWVLDNDMSKSFYYVPGGCS